MPHVGHSRLLSLSIIFQICLCCTLFCTLPTSSVAFQKILSVSLRAVFGFFLPFRSVRQSIFLLGPFQISFEPLKPRKFYKQFYELDHNLPVIRYKKQKFILNDKRHLLYLALSVIDQHSISLFPINYHFIVYTKVQSLISLIAKSYWGPLTTHPLSISFLPSLHLILRLLVCSF